MSSRYTGQYGGSGGDSDYNYTCPPNTMLTGMGFTMGKDFDSVRTLYCKKPNQLNSSDNGTPVNVQIGRANNDPRQFNCPPGSAISDIKLGWDDAIGNQTFTCRRLTDDSVTLVSQQYGRNKGANASVSCKYVTGMRGRYGSYIDSLSYQCTDFSAAKAALTTDEGRVQCCMGLTNPDFCDMTPQSAQCDQFMMSYCQSHPGDPRCACIMSEMDCPNKFDKNCIKNNAYRTGDMVRTPCPNVMNCTQFVSLSPGAQAIATNVDQNCASAQKTGATSTTPPIPATMPTSGGNNVSLNTGGGVALVFIFLFILLIIIGAVAYLIFSGHDDADDQVKYVTPQYQMAYVQQ
jgi:hypothetical protein